MLMQIHPGLGYQTLGWLDVKNIKSAIRVKVSSDLPQASLHSMLESVRKFQKQRKRDLIHAQYHITRKTKGMHPSILQKSSNSTHRCFKGKTRA